MIYRTSDYLRIAGLALLYAVLARLVLGFFSANGVVSIVWPPSGLAVAALLIGGRKYWPGVFLGALVGNLMAGSPVGVCLAIACGNTLEALACHWMLTRIDNFDSNLAHPLDFLRVSIAGMLGASLSAMIGVSALVLSGLLAHQDIVRNLMYWWQGDAISIILFTPLLIVWQQLPQGWFNRERVLETITCFGLTFLTAQIICFGLFREFIGSHIRSYWMVLFVVWAAIRFGRHGALLVISVTSVFAVMGATQRTGIFAGDFGLGGLINVWFYILALTITGITLALTIERERKTNEVALNSSEERLRIAADSGQVGIWEVNLQSGKLIWDDTCFVLYKMQRENFSGSFEEWAERLHPDDLEATVAAFQKAAAGGGEYNTEFRIIWPDGQVRYIKAHGRLIKDQAGRPARMIGTNWDNWAHAHTQQKLQLAQTTIDLSKSAFYRISPTGQVVYVNDAACQSLGYSRKELVGMHVWDFDLDFPPEAWPSLWEGLKQTKVVNIETRHQRKDGSTFPVEVVGNIINDGGEEYSFVFVQDITERKNAEVALKQSHDLFNKLSQRVPGVIYQFRQYLDGRSCFPFASEGIHDMFEVTPEQVREDASAAFAILHPEDYDRIVASIEESAHTLNLWQCEFRVVLPKQGVRWRLGESSPERLEDGSVLWHGFIYDITERKQAEDALRLTQFVVDHSSVEVYRIDPEGRILYVNQWVCQAMGYSLDEMLTMTIPDIDPAIQAEQWQAHWQDLRKNGTVNIETLHRRKDGSVRSVEVAANYVNYDDQEYNVAFVRDITERKQTEVALRASEAILSATINSSLDAVVHMDSGGIITRWNTQAEKIFGWSRDEAIGRMLHETIIPLHYREAHIRGMKHFITSGEGPVLNSRIEISALHSDGNEFPVELSITPLKIAGEYEFSAFIRDITGRKQAEERILRLSHLYMALSEVNQAIVRMEKQDELFPLVCRCAVKFGGMTMAWIGQLDETSGLIVPAASHGSHLDFLDGIVVSSNADVPEGCGAMGRALRENRSVIINDYLADSMTAPWRERAANCGWNSQAAFPIPRGGKPFAILSVYHAQIKAFDKEAIALLEEMAKDISFALDNFDREVQRNANEQSLQLAASVYEASSEGMVVMDAEGKIIAINPAFTAISGYLEEEVVGQFSGMFKSDLHDESYYQAIAQELNATGKWQGEIMARRKNGEAYPTMTFINDVFNKNGSLLHRIALFNDTSHIKEFNELIWQQANFDSLTGLPNRQMFQDRLEQEIKKAHRTELPLTLLFLDLDYFKEVNDTLGHAKGDMLLKEASTRLSSCTRESDTVARFGGDEFTILLSELHDADSVDRVIQDILQVLSEPFQLGNEVAYVSVSIGVTCYPDDGMEIDTLLKNADQAMYAAKAAGRNGFSYYTPAMQVTAQFRMRLANDLRGALLENQLWVAYQPIIELKSGKIIKAEALVRWQHPKHGLVNPAEFISIAEHTGLINDIGEFVFRQAAQQVKHWKEIYHDEFQISVNVSPVQINDKSGKYKPWAHQLKSLGLKGKSIVVEITEGLLLEANASIKEKLLEFRDAGIHVALDDFGTGYSSLSYLKKFDIDYIKIDQSFIRNLSPKSGDLALCEAMIVMAHKLGMLVIAEGVETTDQRDLLIKIGCDYAQGYLFSRPIPVDDFEKLLLKNKH